MIKNSKCLLGSNHTQECLRQQGQWKWAKNKAKLQRYASDWAAAAIRDAYGSKVLLFRVGSCYACVLFSYTATLARRRALERFGREAVGSSCARSTWKASSLASSSSSSSWEGPRYCH